MLKKINGKEVCTTKILRIQIYDACIICLINDKLQSPVGCVLGHFFHNLLEAIFFKSFAFSSQGSFYIDRIIGMNFYIKNIID